MNRHPEYKTYRHIGTHSYNIDMYDDGYSDGKDRYIMTIIQEFTDNEKPLRKKVFYFHRKSDKSLDSLESSLKDEKTIDQVMLATNRSKLSIGTCLKIKRIGR